MKAVISLTKTINKESGKNADIPQCQKGNRTECSQR